MKKLFKIGLTFAFILTLFSVVYASSTGFLFAQMINNEHYTDAGNEAHLVTTLANCDGTRSCKITVQNGTYEVSGTAFQISSNTHLSCNEGAIFKKTASSRFFEQADDPLENVTIEGCKFDINFNDNAEIGFVETGNNIKIKNNHFFNGGAGGSAISLGDVGKNFNNVVISGNLLENVTAGINGIGNNYIVTNNIFKSILVPDKSSEAIDLNEGDVGIISNNIFYGFNENVIDANQERSIITGNIIYLKSDGNTTKVIEIRDNDAIISGNYIYGINGNDSGIWLGTATIGALVTGNYLEGNGTGIGINSTTGSNNNIYSNKYFNLSINATPVENSPYIANIGDIFTGTYSSDASTLFGIGTTPDVELVVKGDEATTSGTYEALSKWIDGSGATIGVISRDYDGANEWLGIQAAGKELVFNEFGGFVGINKVNPNYQLEVNGNFTATDYYSGDGTQGMTGSCGAATTLTVKDGLITACA